MWANLLLLAHIFDITQNHELPSTSEPTECIDRILERNNQINKQ